ncbi:hypothetical protein Cgig2_031649 [Carnegiea gigantea]|uniref:Uncharacterized protein n=1 Tax=Carnegiea gigantea TaxID=171969 RepID=A0A9Q1Q8G8_9CARY|nr:hypothetical protein Cgig2_031649 [Carnegiea gigantea]
MAEIFLMNEAERFDTKNGVKMRSSRGAGLSSWWGKSGVLEREKDRIQNGRAKERRGKTTPNKMRALQSLSSSMLSPDPLHKLFNVNSARSPCYRRGDRLVIRAGADYYSTLGVSRNASKSEIKSGKLQFCSISLLLLVYKKRKSLMYQIQTS